jgi:hypothetical protein
MHDRTLGEGKNRTEWDTTKVKYIGRDLCLRRRDDSQSYEAESKPRSSSRKRDFAVHRFGSWDWQSQECATE